jgi:hypothetical protein
LTVDKRLRRIRAVTHHLVGVHEVARLLKVRRQRVHQLAKEPGFPEPTAVLRAGQIWNRADIDVWKERTRPVSAASPSAPSRDPDRPQDDPWDAEVVRFLLATSEGRNWRRGELMECLRRQPNRLSRQPDRVAQAAALADRHNVDCHPDPGGKTIHFFRQGEGAPVYPRSAAERRILLRG